VRKELERKLQQEEKEKEQLEAKLKELQQAMTERAHSLACASRVRAVDCGAERLRQEQEDRGRIQQEARQLQQQLDQAKRELAESQKVQSEQKQQAHSLACASRVRAVDCGAERLRQEHEDRARIQQEARQLQQQLDQAKRELAESQKVQSEQKQQASQLNEQLRERQRELIKEQELRSKAEEKVCEYRLADRRANAATIEIGRTISPRIWTKPTRVAVANAGNAANTGNAAPTTAPNPKVVDARQTTPAKQRPVPARMVENQQTSLQTSPGKTLKDKNLSEILPVRAPFLDRTNNEPEKDSQQPSADVSHMSPTKIITPRDGLLTPDRWAINRSPLADRMEVRLGNADIKMRSPSRTFLYNGTQVRTVLKRVPTDFKVRLQRKQEFGSTFATGGKHVTFAEEEKTACSPPRWYLDMLEYEQACKLAEEPKARGRSLTPPMRRRPEAAREARETPREETGSLPRWR